MSKTILTAPFKFTSHHCASSQSLSRLPWTPTFMTNLGQSSQILRSGRRSACCSKLGTSLAMRSPVFLVIMYSGARKAMIGFVNFLRDAPGYLSDEDVLAFHGRFVECRYLFVSELFELSGSESYLWYSWAAIYSGSDQRVSKYRNRASIISKRF